MATDNDLTAFLRVRGDALMAILEVQRETTAALLSSIDASIAKVKELDANIGLQGPALGNLIGLMRTMYPQLCEGKTDAEVQLLVGKMT